MNLKNFFFFAQILLGLLRLCSEILLGITLARTSLDLAQTPCGILALCLDFA